MAATRFDLTIYMDGSRSAHACFRSSLRLAVRQHRRFAVADRFMLAPHHRFAAAHGRGLFCQRIRRSILHLDQHASPRAVGEHEPIDADGISLGCEVAADAVARTTILERRLDAFTDRFDSTLGLVPGLERFAAVAD